MKSLPVDLFDRSFTPNDVDVFTDLTKGAVGKPLSRWRETYADGIVFDFGQLVPKSHSARPVPVQDRGEWVISTWGCDLAIRESSREPMVAALDEIKELLNNRIGRRVRSVGIDPANLSLSIQLDDDSEILLLTDRDDRELDQWFITTPSGRSIGAGASGTWYYRENSHD